MGTQGRGFIVTAVAVLALAGAAVGVAVGTGDDGPDQYEQARIDSENGIAATKRGETVGRLLRDKAIDEGTAPPAAVPSEAQCRERWEMMDLAEEYGEQSTLYFVKSCSTVPYFPR